VVLSLFTIVLNVGIGVALGKTQAVKGEANPEIVQWIFSRAIAVGLGSIGAGLAVSAVGAAAMAPWPSIRKWPREP